MQLSPAYVYELAASSPCEMTLYALVSVYVATSLTIPYWVPIVKAYLGQTGVYWVFATLTYYAYLAWLIFAALLAYMLLRVPLAGALWLGVLALRGAQFVRLCRRRAPPPHRMACSSAAPAGAVPRVDATPAAGDLEAPAAAAARPPSARGGADRFDACCGGADEDLGAVLLVGNGPSLRERSLGEAIDRFDTVVRFNSFVTKGMEEHTGSRTTLWCHMMQWCAAAQFRRNRRNSAQFGATVSDRSLPRTRYHLSDVEVAQKAAWLPTCYAWNHVVLAPLFFVPFYLMPMLPSKSAFTWSPATYWRAHRTLGLAPHQVPTTGFVLLMRLLEQVDRVHLVGFDGFAGNKELHYYRERRLQVEVNAAGALLHDWGREQLGIQRLVDEGRVVLL